MFKQFRKTVHNNPRCSVNKLGEYVAKQSSPARRREIIKAQKVPPAYQTVTYSSATKIVVENILAGYDDDAMIDAIGSFFQKAEEAVKDFDKKQAKCCHEALRAFRKLAAELDLSDCIVTPGPQTWSMEISGVTVSIRPELFLEIAGMSVKKKIGFVKFYFSKAHRLDEHSAGVIAAVMIAKAVESMPTGTKVSAKHVLVVDVFGQKIYTAPANTKRLFNEAEAACEEIAFSWSRFPTS